MKVFVWARQADRTADRPVPRRRKAIPLGLQEEDSFYYEKLNKQ